MTLQPAQGGQRFAPGRATTPLSGGLCLLFIHPPAHGSEVSPAARNTLDSARIPRASKLLICGLFQKGRVLAQDGDDALYNFHLSTLEELSRRVRYGTFDLKSWNKEVVERERGRERSI